MLPINLNTNEVKDPSGAEVEFIRHSLLGTTLTFRNVNEGPNTPHRLTIAHKDIGEGSKKRRRSVARVDLTFDSNADTASFVEPATVSAYAVVDAPVGVMNDYTMAQHAIANLVSFLASKGASTTILYDGTGYGAESLINGTL